MEQKLTSSRKILSLLGLEIDGAALVRPSVVRKGTVLFVGESLMTFFVFFEVNCICENYVCEIFVFEIKKCSINPCVPSSSSLAAAVAALGS